MVCRMCMGVLHTGITCIADDFSPKIAELLNLRDALEMLGSEVREKDEKTRRDRQIHLRNK